MNPSSVPRTPPRTSAFARFAAQVQQTAPLSALRTLPGGNVSVGIDGNKLLEMVNSEMHAKDPLALLTTTVPYVFYTHVVPLVTALKDLGLKPVFVFNGMSFKLPLTDSTPARLNPNVIVQLRGAPEDSAARMPAQRRQRLEQELQHMSVDEDGEAFIFHYIRLLGIKDVFRAPYWSWPQLAAFLVPSSQYVSEVFGCLELLAFRGVSRVITGFNLATREFTYVARADVIAEWQRLVNSPLSEPDFSSLLMLDSTHNLVNEPTGAAGEYALPSREFTDYVKDLPPPQMRGGKPLGQFILEYNQAPHQQHYRLRRNMAAVDSTPVLLPDGRCVGLCEAASGAKQCAKAEVFLGAPLPPLYYYLLFIGQLSPAVLTTVTTRQIVDNSPVVDSREYRQCSEMIVPLRTQIVFQLVQTLPERANVDIVWHRRYNNHQQGRQVPILQPPQIKLDEWRIPLDALPPASDVLTFQSVVGLAPNAVQLATYPTVRQASAAVLLKALDLLGYFTHATHTNSAEVSGPSVYCNALGVCSVPTMSEYCVLLIELLRTQTLTDNTLILNPASPEQPATPGFTFATRLMSLAPVTLAGPWSGPQNAALTAFNVMVRSLHRTLRSLTEVIAAILKFSRSCEVPAAELVEITAALPFAVPVDVHMGIIIQYILNNATVTLQSLMETFPEATNIANELYIAFLFWYDGVRIIRKLHEDDAASMQPYLDLVTSVHPIICDRARNILGDQVAYMEAALYA